MLNGLFDLLSALIVQLLQRLVQRQRLESALRQKYTRLRHIQLLRTPPLPEFQVLFRLHLRQLFDSLGVVVQDVQLVDPDPLLVKAKLRSESIPCDLAEDLADVLAYLSPAAHGLTATGKPWLPENARPLVVSE